MKSIFEASSGLEAHMIKNLLESEGIDAQVDGEYLQGGIGELQAMGLVRVLVEEHDVDKARDVIEQWEATTQKSQPETKPTKRKNGIEFLVGVLVTVAFFYMIDLAKPFNVDGLDFNGDGFLDEKWIYKGQFISEVHQDRNRDKTYDVTYIYDKHGVLKSARMDENFDEVFETKAIFRHGNIVKLEADKNQNNIYEYRELYQSGVLRSVEFIDEASGNIRKRQYYKMGRLESADVDLNGDGVFDLHHEYDEIEELR